MLLLKIVTILCIGPLIGTEFAVSAFINPALQKLEVAAEVAATRIFARTLGTVMPFWYSLSLLLLGTAAGLRLHDAGFGWLAAAVGIWLGVAVLSLVFLVPIANRMTRLEPGIFTEAQRRECRRWDAMHRARVAAVIAAFVCYMLGSLA